MRTTIFFSLILFLGGCAPDSIDLPGDIDIPEEVEEEPVFPVDFEFTNTLNDMLLLTRAVATIDENNPDPSKISENQREGKFIF